MTDYIKIETISTQDILNNKHLFFSNHVSIKTGEIFQPFHVAYDHKLTIKYYEHSGRLTISGSIHKFYNSIMEKKPIEEKYLFKGFNYNDFSIHDMKHAIRILCDRYGLDIYACKINSIEFGINIRHEFDTNKICSGLLLHKGKMADRNGWYYVFKPTQYEFKIYNKGAQFQLPYPLLRIELKYKKMEKLKKKDCLFLNQLLDNPILFKSILTELLNEFNSKLIFYDYTLDFKRFPKDKNTIQKVKEYRNPLFWNDLKSNRRDREKKKLIRYTHEYSDNIREQLSILIETKWNALTDSDCVKFDTLS